MVDYGKSVVGESTIWYPLIDDFVIGTIGDIVLKHLTIVSGEWHIVGVVDALPDQFVSLSLMEFLATNLQNQNLEAYTEALARLSRSMFGRPSTAYGVTPIVIFRQIAD